ncbi:MAG: MarR family winged helix-turn-helix transcriptional regulator [Nitrosotalea sp.]
MRKLDISDSIGTLIFLASKSIERAAEHEIKQKLGLTPSQWKVILALNMSDGLSQKELADKIYVDTSTLVPIIDKMEKNGLLERKPDLKDRRHNRLFLTKKAESTVDSIVEEIIQLRKLIYKGISKDEQESMRPHLKNMIDNAEKILDKH